MGLLCSFCAASVNRSLPAPPQPGPSSAFPCSPRSWGSHRAPLLSGYNSWQAQAQSSASASASLSHAPREPCRTSQTQPWHPSQALKGPIVISKEGALPTLCHRAPGGEKKFPMSPSKLDRQGSLGDHPICFLTGAGAPIVLHCAETEADTE